MEDALEPIDVDFSSFGSALQTFFQVVGAILTRQRGVIASVEAEPGLLLLSLQIVALAGASEAAGQSVLLIANRVRRTRYIMSIITSGILYLGSYFIWVTTIWLIALIFFQHDAAIIDVIRSVGLGYAPLLFGFISFIPYFGTLLLNLLYLWAFTAIVSAVSTALEISVPQSIVCCLAGGFLILRIRATLGRPLVKLVRRIRNFAAGTYLELDIHQALAFRDEEKQDG